jgi:hypothetical protein
VPDQLAALLSALRRLARGAKIRCCYEAMPPFTSYVTVSSSVRAVVTMVLCYRP